MVSDFISGLTFCKSHFNSFYMVKSFSVASDRFVASRTALELLWIPLSNIRSYIAVRYFDVETAIVCIKWFRRFNKHRAYALQREERWRCRSTGPRAEPRCGTNILSVYWQSDSVHRQCAKIPNFHNLIQPEHDVLSFCYLGGDSFTVHSIYYFVCYLQTETLTKGNSYGHRAASSLLNSIKLSTAWSYATVKFLTAVYRFPSWALR